jgi:SAM-dependent methyltransferase
MYRALRAYAPPEAKGLRVLAVSHSTELCHVLRLDRAQIVEADYPEYDLLRLTFPDASFDWVVADQVLEHVGGDPATAVAEAHRVLRPGGTLVLTTCLMNPIHQEPDDYWRFTPQGLRFLAQRFGRIRVAGGWGNPYVLLLFVLGLRFEGIPEGRWHPLRRVAEMNHPGWPVTTWLVAEK